MDRIWALLRRLPEDILDSVSVSPAASSDDFALPHPKRAKLATSSSRAAPEDFVPAQLRKINDYVYEVHNPAGRPSIELVFFHGLELMKGSPNTYCTSWLSRDGSELWLNWIVEVFPECRIITISYAAPVRRTDEDQNKDLYITAENLLQCLIEEGARVGQDGCPVVLVGHCLGGLVMKELCVKAHSELSPLSTGRLKTLLSNIKGLFSYASPYHGTKLADMDTNFRKGSLFEDATTLNTDTERRNEHFRKLRQTYNWKSYGIGESKEVTLGSFTGLVVTEASARYDVDGFYTDSTDHFNVSRPDSRASSSFTLLTSLITSVLKEEKARPGPKISLPDDVVGFQQQVIDVQKMLKRARRLAIFGMGGIGKTTLAKTLYNSISGTFEYTCFLRDVKTKLDTSVDVDVLREKVIQSLFYKGKKVDGDNFDWSTLKRAKVLIILDDVASESQVKVMIEEDGFLDESRLIVTSRDKEFLVQEEFEIYNTTFLGIGESKQLFCNNAFKKVSPTSGYEDLVVRFVHKCDGLPLALKIAGKYVHKQSKEIWETALKRLSNAKALNGNLNDGLWSILRVSYDSLQEEEKEMFLDIATLHFGRQLDVVKELWKICNSTYDDCGWKNLVDKGLVTVGEDYSLMGEKGQLIRMHEVLRDLGRSIACPDPQNIASHTRVLHLPRSLTDVSHELFQNKKYVNYPRPVDETLRLCDPWPFHQGVGQEKPKVKVLSIILPAVKVITPRCINIEAIQELQDLRVFWLDGGILSGACHLFPCNLLCVKLRNIKIWIDSDVEESFPKALEQHQTLQYLAIEDSDLNNLPRSFGLIQSLQHLTIKNCGWLRALPDTLGGLRALNSLCIENCGRVSLLPDSLGQLKALEELTLQYCRHLYLPNSLGELQAIKRLVIRNCRSLGVLQDTLGQLKALEHLEIEHHGLFEISPNTLGQLQALKHLDLASDHFGGSFPDSINRGLEYLRIQEYGYRGSGLLEAIPNSLGEIKALKHLEFNSCSLLKALPDSLGELHALEDLLIENCSSFEYLPDTLGQLKCLKRLHLLCGLGLKAIPDTIGELQTLKDLHVSASGLDAFPSTLGQLQALVSLELWGCTALKSLPDTIGRLQALKYLTVLNCGLEALPGSIAGLQALEELQLQSCAYLEALPDTLGLLHALKRLEISLCDKFEGVPVTLGHLQSLESLTICLCRSLRSLPDTLGQLEALEELTVKGCDSLEDLPGSLKAILERLNEVHIDKRYKQVSSSSNSERS